MTKRIYSIERTDSGYRLEGLNVSAVYDSFEELIEAIHKLLTE